LLNPVASLVANPVVNPADILVVNRPEGPMCSQHPNLPSIYIMGDDIVWNGHADTCSI